MTNQMAPQRWLRPHLLRLLSESSTISHQLLSHFLMADLLQSCLLLTDLHEAVD
jgi:hypothetical protein